MSSVAYITNIAPDAISGGFSAMNRAMFDFLSLEHIVDYIGPVNPKPNLWEKALSKTGRTLKLGGNFYYFSRHRLEAIRSEVENTLEKSKAEYAVFHGFTPWIHTRPRLPYIAWSDCTFFQYVRIFHDAKVFRANDLKRIQEREASWLQKAERVIFRSAWAASEAIQDYNLAEDRVGVVGNFGFLTPPQSDNYQGAKDFLMITTNFRQKGGPVVLEAFRLVRTENPDIRLILVGDHPGETVLQEPGVVYLGWIEKSNSEQIELLNRTIAGARCIVHPTIADTNPMVLIEAGYFGCPAISTRRYAIPELVVDGVSGLLLDDPTDVAQLVKYMDWMLQQDERYRLMRKEARDHMLGYYTRKAFQQRLSLEISSVEAHLK